MRQMTYRRQTRGGRPRKIVEIPETLLRNRPSIIRSEAVPKRDRTALQFWVQTHRKIGGQTLRSRTKQTATSFSGKIGIVKEQQNVIPPPLIKSLKRPQYIRGYHLLAVHALQREMPDWIFHPLTTIKSSPWCWHLGNIMLFESWKRSFSTYSKIERIHFTVFRLQTPKSSSMLWMLSRYREVWTAFWEDSLYLGWQRCTEMYIGMEGNSWQGTMLHCLQKSLRVENT